MDIPVKTYCSYVAGLDKDNVHKKYHDNEYGFPLHDDNELFARLVLEINQAGLSWTTILNKKENFFKAYDNFEIRKLLFSPPVCLKVVLFIDHSASPPKHHYFHVLNLHRHCPC